MSTPLPIADQAGPITVTLVYLALYYALMFNILRVKFRLQGEYAARGDKFDRYFGNDREMLAADRLQLNLLEHMPPFLALLWLHALFVGTTGATVAGTIYIVARLVYPLTIGTRMGRSVRNQVMIATVPGYGVIAYLAGALAFQLWMA